MTCDLCIFCKKWTQIQSIPSKVKTKNCLELSGFQLLIFEFDSV